MQESEPGYTIRAAQEADAPALVEVIFRAFEEYRGKIQPPSGAHAETASSIAALLQGGESALIAESHSSEAIGCVFFRPHPQYADVIYLHRLAVVPEARAQGVASALMAAVEENTRAEGRDYVWLGVRIALPANRAYYQKRGYLPIAYAAHAGFAQPTYVTMQRRVTPPIPRQVLLEEWNPHWSIDYSTAANEVRNLFGENLREIHHIGSTAIPGMIAKPTIDLLAIVDDLAQVDRTEPRLILSGWQPRGENGIPGRRYFRKGSESHHTHHLHVYTKESPKVRQHLAFVAWLRAHPEDAQRYAELKHRLAQQYPWDPGAYAAAKSDLVEEILQRRVTPPIPRQVLLEEWNPRWSSDYALAADEVRNLLGDNLRGLHHIGSTSIAGMVAKPIIDLLAIVDDLVQVDRTEPRLILSGWQPRGENGVPGRRYFRKGSDPYHTHHLHAYTMENSEVRRHLAFVYWLRSHPEDAQRYADLKQKLAQQHAWDVTAYTDAKSDLIEEILQRALASFP